MASNKGDSDRRGKDSNPDPITGAPGSHPVGTGVGAAGGGAAGAAAGAAIGSVVPGIGTVVGGVVGAVAGAVGGGYAGKGVAESIDPTAESAYWRDNYKDRPYVESGKRYEDYEPAYQYGWESRGKYADRNFDEVETDLRSDWERRHGNDQNLNWDKARSAVRDAWDRVGSGQSRELNAGEEARLPVVEEQIQVGKRQEERGGARISTNVTEKPVEQQVNLREEHVRVERHNVDRPATDADLNNLREGQIEVTETVERPVVQKEARVVEEVVVGKQATNRTETVRDTVRRTDVNVEQAGGATQSQSFSGSSGSSSAADYDTDYRTHYQSTFGSGGLTYDHYAPAYRYGQRLAGESRYHGKDWSTFESDARRDWETHNPGTWEKFKDAVRYGWNKMSGKR